MCAENPKKVILAVDDVSMNLIIIKNLLSDDFDVRVAKSGEAALFLMGRVKVDLVLLDIEMPGMSGFDFIKVKCEIPDTKDIPIICVTSHANAEFINRAIRAGVKDYIIKPLDKNILKEKISAILNTMPQT